MPQPPTGVAGPASSSKARDRTKPLAPEGSYVFRVKAIRDLGWVKSKFSTSEGRSESDRPMLRVFVEANLPDGAGTFTLMRDVTHSYDARSILCLLGGVILGIDPNDKSAELDYRKLVQGQFMGQVLSRSYHPREDGVEDETTLHYYTEWRGPPLPVPAGMEGAAPARRDSAPEQHEPADPGPDATHKKPGGIAIPGSEITPEVWTEVAPVLRRVFDTYFTGDAGQMHAYFKRGDFGNGHEQHASVVLGFLEERGPNDVRFTFAHRADADARDLQKALEVFEKSWQHNVDVQPPPVLPF